MRNGSRARQRGAVTAETAVVLPILTVFTVGLVWLVSLGLAEVRALDAAREAARVVARGDPPASARSLGARVAPDGSALTLSRGGGRVVVTVHTPVEGPGGLFGFLPTYHVRAQAVAATEQDR
ncbi:MAG: TadE family type IV pilus minor pilin [Marmoricola sp.]